MMHTNQNSLPVNLQYYRLKRVLSKVLKDVEITQKSVIRIEKDYLSREGKKHNNMARLHLIIAMQEIEKSLNAEQINQQREQINLFYRQES